MATRARSTALITAVLAAAAAYAPSAAAQADSALAVSRNGASLMRLNADGGFVVRGTEGEGSLPATGAGVRMMWFPNRAAFRAGRVGTFDSNDGSTYWDLNNVGVASAAFGTNTRASGASSFAAGYRATASGTNSFAVNGTASGLNSVAMGDGAQATNEGAVALGPSSIAGGLYSIVLGPSIANGNFGVAIGLQNSASGQFSVAIGKNARTANRQGSVVLGDGCAGFSSDSVYPTANNQFVARGCGGIRFFTTQNLSSGVEVAPGGGSWSSISDRNRKENFLDLDGEDVLARLRNVPVSTWNYRTQDASIRHMGPMAQDFAAAFSLGESNLLINTVDIDGVNMAGVKALTTRTDALRTENEQLRAENAQQAAQIADLRARMERLEALVNAGQGTAPKP
ncbi:tail fiber domain-containing protein [Longimicrobium terrae]|uniref:Cell division protein FtsB n=1 Tax=Longimicrobium terrae TaxID=1639882 RepID=A0A841H3V5_9BACT|nr:tail fiber domain-containing protein [Longimicrobium terrae]MBB4638655.1 cell division protein FtsB [Longimicrobium terrae]MBB6072895.1 cell division protein FtsB [Longimicrobium terrae]NNC31508.1 hypothetical protein [Longimicrobium terrae]